jgi:hypothetical protein
MNAIVEDRRETQRRLKELSISDVNFKVGREIKPGHK